MKKKIIFAFLYILLFPALLFVISGDFIWPEGWIFSIWFLGLCYTTILYLYRKDPALLEERYKQPLTETRKAGTGMSSTDAWPDSSYGSLSCRLKQNGSGYRPVSPSG